uniref:NAD-dependent epimerase/dehydratase domain-containing protein n=1 Tax=Davidia involucrata TaxID=16924 RepID=A0A5B6YUL3_DAVIN
MWQAYRIQYNWNAIAAIPTNLYSPINNFHYQNSHVLPALIRRFHEAKVSGAKEVVGFEGELVWDTSKPDGMGHRGSSWIVRTLPDWVGSHRYHFGMGLLIPINGT